MNKRPVFIYARVSDPGKGDRVDETASIPRQRAELRKLAEKNGDQVLEVFEEAQTAHEGGRAQYEQMMSRLHEVQAVYVVAYDRLTRIPDPTEQELIRKAFVAARVDIVTPGYTFRYSDPTFDSPETRLHQRALGMFGAFEWDSINRRMRKGKLAKAAQGAYYGQPVPFGYTVTFDPTTGAKRFEVVDAEAQVVRNVFALYIEGYGTPSIARELQALGVPSPFGRWEARHIRAMIRQDTYIGRSTFAGKTRWRKKGVERVSDTPIVADSKAFAPIVDMPTWERAQQQAQARTHRRDAAGKRHLLTGILRCGTCGSPTMSHGTWSNSTLPAYYACRRVKDDYGSGISAQGHSAFYNLARVNQVVYDYLVAELPRYVAGKHRRKVKAKPRSTEMLEVARRRVSEIEKQWASAANLAELGVYHPDEARKRFELLRAEKRVAESHLEALTRTQQAESAPPMPIEGLIEKLRVMDPQAPELREVYVSLLAEVHIKRLPKQGRVVPLVVERVRFVNGEWYPRAPVG